MNYNDKHKLIVKNQGLPVSYKMKEVDKCNQDSQRNAIGQLRGSFQSRLHFTIPWEILIKANIQDQYVEILILWVCGGVLTSVLCFKGSQGDFNV